VPNVIKIYKKIAAPLGFVFCANRKKFCGFLIKVFTNKENTVKSLQICFTGLVLIFLLGACNLRTGQLINLPTATITPTPTVTLAPSMTPLPTPIRRATFTELPTVTRIPSITPMPLLTAIPSDIVLTIQAQVTQAMGGGGELLPFQCKFLSSYPEPGAIFRPKEDFIAIWRVLNNGTKSWRPNDVAFFYRWGTKFQNATYQEDFIPYVVNKKEQLNLHVPMHTLREPGLYSAVWGLRSKKTKEFFCTLSIIIQVVDRNK
jgi:hypothetical protein